MPIEALWDDEDRTAVRLVYGSTWSVRDFEEAYRQTREMMDSVPYPVDVITDVRGTSMLPSDGLLGVVRIIQKASAVNTGSVVIVGASAILKAMALVQLRVLKEYKADYVDTLEEARALLANRRADAARRAVS
jgi:hypothetical protein